MVLSDIAIKRPVFTVMVTVALMTLGLLAFRNIGVDLFPDISFPIVTITTVYPGAGPEEVEQLVTKQIEEAVSSINGVEEVRSFSRDSVSMVLVQFKIEADVKSASNDVRDRVTAARRLLPADIEAPLIQRLDPTAIPILTYAVSSKRHGGETRRITEDVIKPRLEAIDGVASVVISGGLQREIKIYADRRKMDALGLPLAQLSGQIAAEGFDLPGGRINAGSQELSVKTSGRYRSIEDLSAMVVMTLPSGAQVHLSDVATIVDDFKDQRTRTRLDGAESVTFEIQKQGGTNTVAIADNVIKRIAELETRLPPDVKLIKALDTSMFIRQNIHDVTEAIVFGGLMAILVIFLFMLDWRSTLISALALPTSVVTTFLVMWWLGFTFNLMSLMALSLAIGLLIDDAVVVRENIYRHQELGEDPITAARLGTSEIALAVLATTFTIVAVFVPVAFMGGMIGQMFRQFGLTVAAAVLVSLFISFTLDPMMSARVMKPMQPGHHERMRQHRLLGPIVRFYEGMDAYYRGLLAWALEHKKTVVAGAFALFVASLVLVPFMGKEFVAPADRGEFKITLELPAGTALMETDRMVSVVEKLVKENPYVRTIYTVVGPSEESNKASLRVYVAKMAERPGVPQRAITHDIRARLSQLPNLKFGFAEAGLFESSATELPITLYVRGDDYEQLQAAASKVKDILVHMRGVKDADMSFRAGKPETNIQLDRPRAGDMGVNVATVAQTVRLGLEGAVVAKYRDGDRDYDVRLQLSPEDRTSMTAVQELSVMGRQGRLVRVSDVANLSESSGPATIERQNRQRQIIVTANPDDRSLGDIMTELNEGVAKLHTPGVTFVVGGQAKNMAETFTNMLVALAVAILFIYFVLASQFESFLHPFTIMLALPLAIVGALMGLFMAGLSIGMPAMIGIILLMGLVTKNAILLVDYANELREKEHLGIIDALLKAGPTRLRPILMTSAAMVLGMLPAALARGEGSEFRAPMAISVIGGVITSTFLTLLVVPVVYTWVDKFTSRGRAVASAKKKGLTMVPAPAAARGIPAEEQA